MLLFQSQYTPSLQEKKGNTAAGQAVGFEAAPLAKSGHNNVALFIQEKQGAEPVKCTVNFEEAKKNANDFTGYLAKMFEGTTLGLKVLASAVKEEYWGHFGASGNYGIPLMAAFYAPVGASEGKKRNMCDCDTSAITIGGALEKIVDGAQVFLVSLFDPYLQSSHVILRISSGKESFFFGTTPHEGVYPDEYIERGFYMVGQYKLGNAENPINYDRRGDFLQNLGMKNDGAADFLSALKINPKDHLALLNLSNYRHESGAVPEAIAYLEMLVSSYPNLKDYLRLGNYYKELGDFEKARENYNIIINEEYGCKTKIEPSVLGRLKEKAVAGLSSIP